MPVKRKYKRSLNKKVKKKNSKRRSFKKLNKYLKKRTKRRNKRISHRRSKKVKKKKMKRRYRRVQKGCAKQKGGSNCVDYNCEYPKNMGEIMTGTKNNLQGSDLIPETTQNRLPSLAPKQSGGSLIGFDGLGTSKLIDFGLSQPLTTARNGMNYFYDIKNTWNGDRKVASADPIVPGKMDNS